MTDHVDKYWVCERHFRTRETIVVQARSRKEAQAKLDAGKGESVDALCYAIGKARVIREDCPK